MRQVIVKQWFESEGGYDRTPRYSLHPNSKSCLSFVHENADRRLHPQGTAFQAEVDDEVFDEVESADKGIWYSGKVRRDGEDVDLSEPKD
jgi:hypothetical protein